MHLSRDDIPCRMTDDGVLIPDLKNPLVFVHFDKFEGDEGVSGSLTVGNNPIAYLEYDYLDRRIIGFYCTDLSLNAHITEISISNIVNYINSLI